MKIDPKFWIGKRVFLTGHTGFKGGWLTVWLSQMGAKVMGYALPPNTQPNLYEIAGIASLCKESHIGDVRDLSSLRAAFIVARPEIVIHMAAQSLVRYSYSNPIETYETNVMGTANLLECIRSCNGVQAALVVTTDKCYENKEWVWGYRETEPMGGHDPYSSSKGCAELITSAYRQSFFAADQYSQHHVAIATARAGNVIGGGDWSQDRLIPDALTAFEAKKPLLLRNPLATRPWQHVLEPLSGYLTLIQGLYQQGSLFNGAWNFGPEDIDVRSVKDVIELLIEVGGSSGVWQIDQQQQPHEAHSLKLDCSKARQILGWNPRWSLEMAIEAIVQWQKLFNAGGNIHDEMRRQINVYCA